MSLDKLFNTSPFKPYGTMPIGDDYAHQFKSDVKAIQNSELFATLKHREQVFPTEGWLYEDAPMSNCGYQNRFTHSEKAGHTTVMIVNDIVQYFGDLEQYHWPALGFGGGIGHDIGTPPLSHTFEKGARRWIVANFPMLLNLTDDDLAEIAILYDLASYEANANLLRYTTSARHMPKPLSYAMHAAMLKYPFGSGVAEDDKPYNRGDSKIGFYSTNSKQFKRIAAATGLKIIGESNGRKIYARHPMAIIVKAADSITYTVQDPMDAINFDHYSMMEIRNIFSAIHHSPALKTLAKRDPKAYLSEACKILWKTLAEDAAQSFIQNKDAIFTGTYRGDLLKSSKNFGKISASIRKVFETRVLQSPQIQRHRAIFTRDLMIVLDAVTHTMIELNRSNWNPDRLGGTAAKLYEVLSGGIPNILPSENSMYAPQSTGFMHVLHHAFDAMALVPRERMIHEVAAKLRDTKGIKNILTHVTKEQIGLARTAKINHKAFQQRQKTGLVL